MITPPGKPYILYIEDDYEDVELLHYVLKDTDVSMPVVNAVNGEEALDLLHKAKSNKHLPAIILLDINMPKLNGKETFALLKADKELTNIPIVAVSTSTLQMDRDFFNSHHVQYIVKPGDIKKYKAEITSVLSLNVPASGNRHQCIIYTGSPAHKLNSLAQVMLRKLRNGYRCLYMNSEEMLAEMRSCIVAMGVDVEKEIAEKKLVLSSAPVCVDEDFDTDRMLQQLEQSLNEALTDGFKGLWASGDMTWELGSEKNHEKLMEYEWKLESLFKRREELQGICQYHYDTLPHDLVRQGLLMHGTIYINETNTCINPHHNAATLPVTDETIEPLLDEMIEKICKAG